MKVGTIKDFSNIQNGLSFPSKQRLVCDLEKVKDQLISNGMEDTIE